jgi:predicted RNase H-like nuclease (RuvC/YqgF family)
MRQKSEYIFEITRIELEANQNDLMNKEKEIVALNVKVESLNEELEELKNDSIQDEQYILKLKAENELLKKELGLRVGAVAEVSRLRDILETIAQWDNYAKEALKRV